MERYDEILKNELYVKHLEKTYEYEKDRIFCHHDMSHFLDVARIGMLINLTDGYGISKDIIYAAALLHDVGRDVQYENGTPHEIASAEIAEIILKDTDYTEDERRMILKAVKDHRDESVKDDNSLSGLIYRADKLSRPCYYCRAEKECNHKKDKKNAFLIW
ncbi:MAG: HD domain-containing protein [Lachnospiraceae bacterium]|nr:HD domain-containing protein [Lachnospiraceae bacterium]